MGVFFKFIFMKLCYFVFEKFDLVVFVYDGVSLDGEWLVMLLECLVDVVVFEVLVDGWFVLIWVLCGEMCYFCGGIV